MLKPFVLHNTSMNLLVSLQIFDLDTIAYMTVHVLIVLPDESRGYLSFIIVTPPPQKFSFQSNNLKIFCKNLSNLVCGYFCVSSQSLLMCCIGLPLKKMNGNLLKVRFMLFLHTVAWHL